MVRNVQGCLRFESDRRKLEGLENAYKWYVTFLERLDFKVELIFNDDAKYRPIIVACSRAGEGYDSYIGFFQHYDVEPIHANWETSPGI